MSLMLNMAPRARRIAFGVDMSRLKKGFIWVGVSAVTILGISWSYVLTTTVADFELLLLCSQGKEEWIPKAACQRYLFAFRGNPDEIARLNQGVGIRWATDAERMEDKAKLVSFLLKKGVDIDAIDQHSGISALHAAVLENNSTVVELLLRNGANPSVRDRAGGKTPLEMARELSNKPNQPDRTEIIKLLQSAEFSPSPNSVRRTNQPGGV